MRLPFLIPLVLTAACGALDTQTYDVLTQGTVLTPEGPIAPGPVLSSGEGVAEFAFVSGIVPYDQLAQSEPADTTAASDQIRLRMGVSTGGSGDFNVVGTLSPLRLGRSMDPRLQQADIGQGGVLGAFTVLQRFDFVPSDTVSAGISLGTGIRSAAFVRTIDDVENRGGRATWYAHGGVHGGGEVSGPLWLGASISFENLLHPTGARAVEAESAGQANRRIRRFTQVAVFTPSFDVELRFGPIAIAGSVFSSVALDPDAAALPFSGRVGMRFYFGGGDPPMATPPGPDDV